MDKVNSVQWSSMDVNDGVGLPINQLLDVLELQ